MQAVLFFFTILPWIFEKGNFLSSQSKILPMSDSYKSETAMLETQYVGSQ